MRGTGRPVTRLVVASVVLGWATAAARRDQLAVAEEDAFRLVNELPDDLYHPLWPIMQLGTLGAAPVCAAVALMAGERRLAGRLVVSGTVTWLLAKVVKRQVHRPRPALLLDHTRRRGADAKGLGYLSGHAGVVVALATAALPYLDRRSRLVVKALVPSVAAARMYVGAHLPLDVVGGAALGLGVEAAVELWPFGL